MRSGAAALCVSPSERCYPDRHEALWDSEFGVWNFHRPGNRAWSRRFLFSDGARDLSRVAILDAIWTLASKKLVKNHAKAIDIARGGHRFSADLFRAGVFRCHR